MGKKIETLKDLLISKRWKTATNNRQYNNTELTEVSALFAYIKDANKLASSYKTFASLCTYDVSDLIARFQYLLTNSTRRTKETYAIRYGIVEGNIRWESYVALQRTKNLYETKKEKYGWSMDDFDTFNKSRAVTLENLIKKHGEASGYEKWQHYLYRQKYTNSIEYFIEKYGKKNGKAKWLLYNKEKGKSSNLYWIMEKYDVNEDGALAILRDRQPKTNSSDAELNFIKLLEEKINRKIKYTAYTTQFCIWNVYTHSPKFYDLVDTATKKIIEFNGDYWHCNPARYAADFVVKQSNKTAKEIWQNDYYKTKAALDRGFQVKKVWSSEFEQNPNDVVEECKQWLNTK